MTHAQKQCLLVYFGFLEPDGIDGLWGKKSARATRLLQKKLGITADGVWGEETEEAVLGAMEEGLPPEPEEKQGFWANIRYWKREEFRCRCGEYHAPYCNGFPAEPDRILVELADDIRHDLGAPGIRSSGLRCRRHNGEEGGVENSRHLFGKALDFMVEGISAEDLLARAKADPRCRYAYIIGKGPFVHVDVN